MPKLVAHLDLSNCPLCGVNTPNLYNQCRFDTTGSVGNKKRFWVCYSCTRCGGVVTAAAEAGPEGDVTEVYPAPSEIDETIPGEARTYLSQARDTLHAPSASVMVSASAVDAMLKARNYKEGSLYSRIEQAVKDHLITEEMSQWAHDVRLDANDQRHADEGAKLPDETDARRCLDFALAFAQFLFVLPARVKRGLARTTP